MFHHWSHFRHAKEKLLGEQQTEDTASGSHSAHPPETFSPSHEAQSAGLSHKPEASGLAHQTDITGHQASNSDPNRSSTLESPAAVGGISRLTAASETPEASRLEQSSPSLGSSVNTSAPNVSQSMMAGNIFVPISNDPPVVPRQPTHPVSKYAVRSRTTPVSDTRQRPLGLAPQTPLQTNKFYANLFLGEQTNSAWTQPYSLWWSKGRGNANSWGMSITHTEKSAIAYGPNNSYGACNYFFGPIGKTVSTRLPCKD
jgi:endoglucanase Acf2